MQLLAKPQPSISEFGVAILLSFIAIIAFTYVDINIFNNYVLPDIETGQATGELYWATLNGIVLFVGGSIFVGRLPLPVSP